MHAMAKALLDWETIDGEQIDDIMAGRDPRPPKDWTPRTPPTGGPSGAPGRGQAGRTGAHGGLSAHLNSRTPSGCFSSAPMSCWQTTRFPIDWPSPG
jgi:hypothetical protein